MLEAAAPRGTTGPISWGCAMSALLVGYDLAALTEDLDAGEDRMTP